MKLERLNELFEYNDQTGIIFCKTEGNAQIKRKIGSQVGTVNTLGYMVVNIDSKVVYCHRIAFMLFHGYLPKHVDHIDTDRSNNKISNLRPCTQSENNFNANKRCDNKSGIKGVWWDKERSKYQVCLSVMKKKIRLGRFDTIIDAKAAIMKARDKYHGDFAKH